ncbi:3818_t:CDS:2 [Paraglomus brasilianum]|uniref:Vacuolar calcium ion transporter n=1 Tax=Paraglomus brasilianum TaxID=144538 RepID=A0A9N8WJN2_9GLOM|nr:3818_t:CDS:2 [Paraglomus brasilianum]
MASHTIVGIDENSPLITERTTRPLKTSWINSFLIFVPFGFLSHFLNWSDTWVFVTNFLAIIPLAKLLVFATDDLSRRTGQTVGALLNATFGNAIELIIGIVALFKGEIVLVQASMMGSIISNLLLVLGACFLAGGIKYSIQEFNETTAQTNASLMTLACIALIIPASFSVATHHIDRNAPEVVGLSHYTAIVLLIVYVLYLLFQLKTHAYLYTTNEESERPELPLAVSVILLAVATVIVAACSEFLVSSIEGITESLGLPKIFVGLILLPVVGNAAESMTAISAAIENKMQLAIGIAAGSSLQIALFVTPFLVVLGWIINQPMTLSFDLFETILLSVSVLIMNYLIQDGKSNWLEGALLLATYAIIAIAFYFYPADIPGTIKS